MSSKNHEENGYDGRDLDKISSRTNCVLFNIPEEVGAASRANESAHFRSAYLTGFFWV